jgi:hypothetical protein
LLSEAESLLVRHVSEVSYELLDVNFFSVDFLLVHLADLVNSLIVSVRFLTGRGEMDFWAGKYDLADKFIN